MGTECSCVFTNTPGYKNTEMKLLSPEAKSLNETLKADSVSIHDLNPLDTFQSEIFRLPALSHLFQFYARTAHRIPGGVLKLQQTLSTPYITDEDIFDLPVECEEDIFYFGQWEKDHKSGKGIQINQDGSIYTGHFHKSRYSGLGRLIYPNCEYYEGEFHKNKPHGQGCHYFSKSKYIKGEYYKGEIQGICTISWHKVTYTGEFQAGCRTGIGKLTQDSKVFEGEFVNNLIQGFGCCQWENGKKYSGEWKNNKMHGYGLFEWPDGRKYEGEYVNGVKHGRGKMTWPDGKVYCGEWQEGKQHGTADYTFFNKKSKGMETRKGRWADGFRVEWVCN